MAQHIGAILFQIGGMMTVIGFILVRYPKAFSWFGHLPGDFMSETVIAPIASMLAISICLSVLSWMFRTLLRLIR